MQNHGLTQGAGVAELLGAGDDVSGLAADSGIDGHFGERLLEATLSAEHDRFAHGEDAGLDHSGRRRRHRSAQLGLTGNRGGLTGGGRVGGRGIKGGHLGEAVEVVRLRRDRGHPVSDEPGE